MERQDPRTAALEVVSGRFGDAAVTFLSGSVMRGEATETSDLDLVVVYERVGNAYRESFVHGGWPVEAFVHDPETLRYFFWKVDRATGVPSLPDMVVSGVALPRASEFSRSLQALAEEVIAAGPPVWSKSDIDASRYTITNLVDDLRAPRSKDELFAIATDLYSTVAEYFLRTQGLWSATGKAIPRRLNKVSPEFSERFNAAFLDVFENGRSRSVIELCQELLAPCGGWLFAGHKAIAPREWRLSSAPPAHNNALEQTRHRESNVNATDRSGVIRLADAQQGIPGAAGERSVLVLQRGTLDVKLALPVPPNQQTPHAQDEIYVVIRGRGVLVHDDKRDPFESGDLLFVAAGTEHHYEDFTKDLALWRVFYGQPGGEVPT